MPKRFYPPPGMKPRPPRGHGGPTMYEGEQTLLETRPTRLISFKFYVATFLSWILAVVFLGGFIDRIPAITIPFLGWSSNLLLCPLFRLLWAVSRPTAALKSA